MLNVIKKTTLSNEWLKDIEKEKAIYNFIVGGRNGRKSSNIQLKILNDYFTNSNMFLLIRRKTDETVSEKWFTPYVTKYIKQHYNKLIVFKKSLVKGERYTGYFLLTDKDGKKPQIIGKVMYLSCEQKYKSNEAEMYQDLKNVVYEEFIAKENKAYLFDEVQSLVNLISTVFRNRQAVIYLIGNTLTGQATNPYFRYFELDDLELKVNDLILIENEFKIKILIAYVANVLPSDIPEYQQIKNNLVGTTGEWKEDNNLLKQDINNINAEIETINLKLQYRNKIYYIYSILEKDFKRPYIYITEQILKIVRRNNMDRRQRKTREAIFKAFTELLSKKDFNQITVGEIIGNADVGRATFYSHFETKDFLLKEFCEELFCHIFDAENNSGHDHKHIFECDCSESVRK